MNSEISKMDTMNRGSTSETTHKKEASSIEHLSCKSTLSVVIGSEPTVVNMAQPDVSDGKHADLEAKAEAEHEVEIKRLDEDIDKSMANLLKAIQRELTSREWYIWVDERTMVLQIVCNEVAPSRFEAANSQADFCTQDAILHEDIVMYWLGLAKDISELAAKARTVIEYHIGEPEKQKEIIALTADLLRAGEEIGLANTHAAAVKGVAENRVSYMTILRILGFM